MYIPEKLQEKFLQDLQELVEENRRGFVVVCELLLNNYLEKTLVEIHR
jgi:hypothetical protein